MKRRERSHHNTGHKRGWRWLKGSLSMLTILTVGLGSVVSGGCLAVPAVMFTTAAVTAVAVVSEGERLVQYPDAGSSAIVQNDTDGESACRQTCQRHEAPTEEDQLDAREEHKQRTQCAADQQPTEMTQAADLPQA